MSRSKQPELSLQTLEVSLDVTGAEEPRRAPMPAATVAMQPVRPPALAHMATTGEARVLLVFGGQGQSYLEDMVQLRATGGEARQVMDACARALVDELGRGGAGLMGLHPHGLDLIPWLVDASSRPPPEALAASPLSQPLIFVAQAARLASLQRYGLDPESIADWAVGVTGHSQGIMAAALAAQGLPHQELLACAEKYARYLLWQGIRMQIAGLDGVGAGTIQPESAMVSVEGLGTDELYAVLERHPRLTLALINGVRRHVVSGPPREVKRLAQELMENEAAKKAFARGDGPPPRVVRVEPINTSAPFHSPFMLPALELLKQDAERLKFDPNPREFVIPMLRYEDGLPWNGTPGLVETQCVGQVNWVKTMRGAMTLDITHVLDLGPGAGVAPLTADVLGGQGVRVLAVGESNGVELLKTREPERLSRPQPWSARAPVAIKRADGTVWLRNAFTRATSRPPILVPGMTPTTADAPMVAAAARAGFWAELAGGGQPTEAIFKRRAQEMRDLLGPGDGYWLNTLCLDPVLFDLHCGTRKLVQRLRAEGHPIQGVTFAAGLPPLEQAVALIRELHGLGMRVNAIKVGSDSQIKDALAVVDALGPAIPLVLQVEGGQGGGHHGLDELDELLLRWYARIRQRPHLLLAAGGGISSAEQVKDLLFGSWSERHGYLRMPVDAVFVGTALMAALEAGTSAAVKQALAQTEGADGLLAPGVARGGVRSGLSSLGANIYYLDNRAARTAALLKEVAGNDAQARARKAELAEALSRTAKPYFGDVEEMTYQAVLQRLVEVMALGCNRPGDDGAWLDPSHRSRFGMMVRRALTRCGSTWLPGEDELADPRGVLSQAMECCPTLGSTPVLPEDARYLIHEVCKAPGKPVPFVPTLDGEAFRWFSLDALWQAHDQRYDAQSVLVLPGPAGVKAITRVDEPVASIMGRMLEASVKEAGQPIEYGPRNPMAMALKTPVCLIDGRERPNPVPAVLAAAGKKAALAPVDKGVRLGVIHSKPNGETVELELGFEVVEGHPIPLRAGPDFAERLRAFYARVMPSEVQLTTDRVNSICRTTLDAGQDVPLLAYFAAALPSLMRELMGAELGVQPLSLLHLESRVERRNASFDPGDELVAQRIDTVVEPASGGAKRITIHAALLSSRNGGEVARLTQVFQAQATASIDTTPHAPETRETIDQVSFVHPRLIARTQLRAPVDLSAFANSSGDLNPIHRDPALAALAGLDRPIVHGQWTATAAAALCTRNGRTLTSAHARFMGMVQPGEPLTMEARATARSQGDELASVTVNTAQGPVLEMQVRIQAPSTAMVFPGQGSQSTGMGMDAYKRSPAARSVWDRADAYTRRELGFSLLEVVRSNPREMRVGTSRVHHPEGVLNLTQFTQVALTVLACALVAELEEQQVIPPNAMFCGHSVGEYAALCAIAGMMPLEAVVEIVYRRGLTMQDFVPRDAHGRSPYAMAAMRPRNAGMDQDEAFELVKGIAVSTGLPLYVVNHNVRHRQYAVAGQREALAQLGAMLEKRRTGSAPAFVPIPGIDVPFHSPLLTAGVPAFRRTLDQVIPRDVPFDRLVDRYIPNLVARPFRLEKAFVEEMIRVCGDEQLKDALANPEAHGRTIFIELLANQFASPVRWIETQDLLVDRVRRVVEVGPGAAPVLCNMLLSTLKEAPVLKHPVDALHAERDRDALLGEGTPEVVESVADKPATAAPVVQSVVQNTETAPSLDDAPLKTRHAVLAALSLASGRKMEEIDVNRSLDDLLGGNSARRNKVLLDVGKEFGLGPMHGAHEIPLSRFLEQVEQNTKGRYRHPGPYLGAAQNEVVVALGRARGDVERELEESFGLGAARRASVLTALCLQGTEQVANKAAATQRLEQAVQRYAQWEGIAVSRRAANAGANGAGSAIPAAALAAATRENKQAWEKVARAALVAAGQDPWMVGSDVVHAASVDARQAARAMEPAPRFDARRVVVFSGVSDFAKADALRLYWNLINGRNDEGIPTPLVSCRSLALADKMDHLVDRARGIGREDVATRLGACAQQVRDRVNVPLPLDGRTALVTGAGSNSIGEALVERLLSQGARVVTTTSKPERSRLKRFRTLYRRSAAGNAELHVVPFEQGSRADAVSLAAWMFKSVVDTRGGRQVLVKEPFFADLVFPFAAAPSEGDPTDYDDQAILALAVNLVGVERLVGALAKEAKAVCTPRDARRMHVVLPLSPNHGQIGRDGLYAEAKAALEAMLQRWSSEQEQWGCVTSLVGARIGWVRGTGLMSGLDVVAKAIEEELNVRTFSPGEMADLLLEHCNADARARAAEAPIVANLTGGLPFNSDLRAVINRAMKDAKMQRASTAEEKRTTSKLPLPLYTFPPLPRREKAKTQTRVDLSKVIAIVGRGEIGPFGGHRVRWSMERDGELSAEAALELAWMLGLVRFDRASWVDATTGEAVDPSRISERYNLRERVGIRKIASLGSNANTVFSEVVLEEDLSFVVQDRKVADSFAAADPDYTLVKPEGDGYRVVRRAGARVRVPRHQELTRSIAAQLPEGFDATRLGLSKDRLDDMDPIAMYNLLATAEAFRSAGLTPEELWSSMHPTRVANTQGSGIGGMRSQVRLYSDFVLDRPRYSSALQDSLINVAGAYTSMAFAGSYGPMLHPVGACATAAVSVEAASDLILSGKADFALAGGVDDMGLHGLLGFGDMGATISNEDVEKRGLAADQSSRPCDMRRAGFVEAQGGGAVLLCRADVAVKLGLPIYGLIAGAWTFGDGLQKSVPAPGIGVLAAASGGASSPLGKALERFGLTADDIAAVSLHGTSTDANDINETRLHALLAKALGRTPGNPLPVIAQKALTGHAKGGAAAWQLIGLTQVLEEGVIPPMRNLDQPDGSVVVNAPLVFPDETIVAGPGRLKAALLTSLGFGHIGTLVCVVHPDVVLAGLDDTELDHYEENRNQRWRHRFDDEHRVMLGDKKFCELRVRNSHDDDTRMLLDPEARFSGSVAQ